MKTTLFGTTLATIIILLWIINFNKLMDCDFETPYKCEIMHGIGIVPILSILTVWTESDKK